MSRNGEKLSAFLDGELPEAEARAIEAALEADAALQAELEALMQADTKAKAAFADMLDAPVPAALAAALRDESVAGAANTPAAPQGARWWMAASVVLALGLGGAGGYLTGVAQGPSQEVAGVPAWLADIADYHRVYASQTRHLVEVSAEEDAHIRTWLTNTVGAPVRTPDLSEHGLTFRGARLLVAAGRPVAQLMYTDAEGAVVALCLIATDTPRDGLVRQTVGAFDMVSWGDDGANWVVVGDEGREDLDAIATTAGLSI